MDSLVSTDWLAAELGAPDLKVVDATYHALDPARDARAAFADGHVPGAVHLDLKTLVDTRTSLPGMAPEAEAFTERMRLLGIGAGDRIVLYDNAPHHTSARAWWLMRMFGLSRVAILDGGWAKWVTDGLPVEQGSATPVISSQGDTFAQERLWLRDLGEMRQLVEDASEEIVDARSAARFTGAESDPRRGIAPGHIPGSKNLPYTDLFNPDGSWKRGAALRAAFEAQGVDLSRPLVATCGSGVTAAVVLFGAHLLGKGDLALYDGSWSEWGADPATPKRVGSAQ